MAFQDKPMTSDPALSEAAEQLLNMLEIAIEQAVAHISEPQEYPLPADGSSQESMLAQRFRQLADDDLARAVALATQSVQASPAEPRAPFGALVSLDRKLAAAISEQQRQLVKSILPPARSQATDPVLDSEPLQEATTLHRGRRLPSLTG